jgi:hypothetical protein
MARPLLLWLTLGWLVALAHANIHQLEKLSPLNPLDETLDKRADTYWLAEVADEGKASEDASRSSYDLTNL